MGLQEGFDIVSAQLRRQAGVVLVDAGADRRRGGERTFRDLRLDAELGGQGFRLQRQRMHQVAHVEHLRALFLDGLRDVARFEIHQGDTGVFHHRAADAVRGVVNVVRHTLITARLEVCWPLRRGGFWLGNIHFWLDFWRFWFGLR